MPKIFSTHTSVARSYRSVTPLSGEKAFQVVVEETDLWVVADPSIRDAVAGHVHHLRGILKAHMALNPEFLRSMTPLAAKDKDHPLIRAMCRASQVTGVGPMAGVAGAIAQAVADEFCEQSPDILVENGGDVYMHSTRERVAGILSDPQGQAGLGVRIAQGDFPLSLCASSARIGHSVSLGHGDLAVVASRDAALADCAATALCNMLKSAGDLKTAMRQAEAWRKAGVVFAFAQCGGQIAVQGDLELAALE
jgi:hypothetical protein